MPNTKVPTESKQKTKYNKKVTISLTEEDFAKLQKLAEDDRRTVQQRASFFVEDAIDAVWVDTDEDNS